MKRNVISGLAACAVLLTTFMATAQETQPESAADAARVQEQDRQRARIQEPALTPEERQARRDQWQNMSAEERERVREERRQQWQALTPEEQARIRERHREQWEAMSPEEKEQVRQQRQERQKLHSGDRGGNGGAPKNGAGKRSGGRS